MATKIYPITVPADNDTEALRKSVALGKIANLNSTSLAAIARAAEKEGADDRLKPYLKFL